MNKQMKEALASVHNINRLIQPLDTVFALHSIVERIAPLFKVNRSTIGVQQPLKP